MVLACIKRGYYANPILKIAESLLVWTSQITHAAYQAKQLGTTFNLKFDISVASIWLLFIKELRLVAKWDPAHLTYVDKLVDNHLGLKNLF